MRQSIISTSHFAIRFRKVSISAPFIRKATRLRRTSSAALALFLVSNLCWACAASTQRTAADSVAAPAIYKLVDGPATDRYRYLIVSDNVLLFGENNDRRILAKSDIGFPLNFVKVAGGIRARGEPIFFPDNPGKSYSLGDFDCTTLRSSSDISVTCRAISDGRQFSSRIQGGYLRSFEIKCQDRRESICEYSLVDGRAIRPPEALTK